MEDKISREVAQEQIDALVEFYGIYPEDMPEEAESLVKASLKAVHRAIQGCRLEIKITGKEISIEQHLDDPPKGLQNPLLYGKVDGNCKIGMKDKMSTYEKVYALLGALSGEGVGGIQKLSGKDLSLAESLGYIFLQI